MENETQKYQLEEDELAKIAKKGRENFFFFARGILGFNKVCKKIHLPLCEKLEDHEHETRLMILLPRDWFKTTLASIAYPLWRAINNPEIRILVVQNTYTNACAKLLAIKQLVEKNQLFRLCYKELLPDSSCVWKSDKLTFKREGAYPEGTFEAAGTGTQVVSRHYDVIIEDDTVAPDKDSMTGVLMQPTKAEIEKAIGWHRLAHPLLIEPLESQILVIGTRWVEGDLLQWVEENEKDYTIITRSVRENEKGQSDEFGALTWPERYNEKVLNQLKIGLGPYMYSALFLNLPLASGTQVFKKDWINYYKETPPGCIKATAVDPAASDSDSSSNPDFNVVLTISVEPFSGRIYVEYYDHERMDVGKLVNCIFNHNRTFQPLKVYIEANAYQRTLIYWINQRQFASDTYFQVEPVISTRSKEERIRGLQPFFASNRIFIKNDMNELETELLSFPRGKHDDLIDALSMLLAFVIEVRKKIQHSYERKYVKNSGALILEELRKRHKRKKSFIDNIGLGKDLIHKQPPRELAGKRFG